MSKQYSYAPICSSCQKPLVAGAYPKWFCLHQDCDNYLKPQTDNE